MSNWEMRPLSKQQLHYAALDAYVLIQITNLLIYPIAIKRDLTINDHLITTALV